MQSFLEYSKRRDGKRTGVLSYWNSLDPHKPIPLTPKPYGHYGTSIDEDTVRITGSKDFVSSIMARLKDLLTYESPSVKLDVEFVPTEYRHAGGYDPNYEFNFSAIYRKPGMKQPVGPRKIVM